ncbi:DUF971 domain-containing protein [Paraburkholderia sp. J12]|uniref:DUF971 domain-containing protein n=1 Tax=Paraburkholderia sp. J12 TaxID=2805432 RepID=UPI002ABD1718|nr:DUF971 domain-containing protein [Paraburkholderia sp. J12]
MNVPVEIQNAPGRLTLVWPDGTIQRLAHADLRRACPCAGCRRLRLTDAPVEVPADVEVNAVASMGYGVQLVFSDGHDRGIFPWAWFAAFTAPQA